MSKFNVGDRVQVKSTGPAVFAGLKGTVERNENPDVNFFTLVRFDSAAHLEAIWNDDLILLAEVKLSAVSTKSSAGACAKCGVVPNPGCLCTGGYKADHDKPDLSLVPTEFSEEMAKAFQYGAKKYSRHNYLTGMEWSRMFAATVRHMYKFWRGEEIDPETGVHHLGHAGAGLGMLFMHVTHKLGTDNRWKAGGK